MLLVKIKTHSYTIANAAIWLATLLAIYFSIDIELRQVTWQGGVFRNEHKFVFIKTSLQKMHFYVCVNLTHSVSKPAILLNILRLFYTSYVLNNVYSISWVKLTLCVE